MSNGKPEKCPVCGGTDWENYSTDVGSNRDAYGYDCPRCGQFVATRHFVISQKSDLYLDDYGSRKRADLSAWLREKSEWIANYGGSISELESSFLEPDQPNDLRDAFEAAGSPRFHEKADKLLLALERQTEYAGQKVLYGVQSENWNVKKWEARAWALNEAEFDAILDYLEEMKRIAVTRSTTDPSTLINLKILPEGWKRIEELASTKQASTQGFVAMWFKPSMKFLFDDAFAPAIHAAGYHPQIIDRDPRPERIDNKIEAEIKRSRFLVADVTGERQNVFYEAGFARGLKIPVFWYYGGDDPTKLPFDTKQFPCFTWTRDKLDELIEDLRWRIENNCGHGPVKDNEAN